MKSISNVLMLALFAGVSACSDSLMPHDDAYVSVEAVSPANGSVVATTTPVSVTFSRAMMQGMEMLIVLHEESVRGPVTSGSVVWSADRRTLTFTPTTSLKAATIYVLHLAPGLQSANGGALNHQSCFTLGGQNVGLGMMGSGGMGPGMMGPGWQAADGTYGMIFTFTTA